MSFHLLYDEIMHEHNASFLDGSTRLHLIVGDPIAQVKSPAGVSQSFLDAGLNAVCVPAHVRPEDLTGWLRGVSLANNVDGIIVTVPHKIACLALCATASDRARFVGAVNAMRRNSDGTWHGDMFDGEGFVRALKAKGGQLEGRTALLVGAGGAGSAIAHAFVLAGVSRLAIHDPDTARRDGLVARLAAMGQSAVLPGHPDPTGFDVLINASPMGMRLTDPYPIEVAKVHGDQFCGCVITAPAVSPWLALARETGCNSMAGADMFAQVRDLLVDFLAGK